MGTTRKFLYWDDSDGAYSEQATDSELTIGGLAVGNIALNSSTHKITGVAAATASGGVLVYGQSGGSLTGLTVDTSNLALTGGSVLTGLPSSPSGDTEATSKAYVDQLAISGGTVKEAILYNTQLDNTDGINAAGALAIATLPISGDTIILSDGTTTRTYGATAGGDVQYTIGGTVAATMQNLATAITDDGTAIWGAVFTTDLDGIDSDGVVVIIEDANSGTAPYIYGTWDTQASCQIVDFTDEADYTKKTLSTLPVPTPAASNFGIRRTQVNLLDGEIHLSLENGTTYSWDDSGNTWQTLSGAGSIPDATAASGGGVKGKVTFDSDYGLSVSSGTATINLETDGAIVFDSSNKGLEINLEASNPSFQISTNELGLKIYASGGLVKDANGVSVKIDDTPDTLDVDSDGLKVSGVPSLFKIAGSAVSSNVTHTNLNTLTAGTASNSDSLHTHADVDAENLIDELTALETIEAGDPVCWSATANKIRKASSDDVTESQTIIGVAIDAIAADEVGTVIRRGVAVGILTTATPGTRYYLGNTGGLTASRATIDAGNHVALVGSSKNATDLELHPQYLFRKAGA